MTIGVMGLGILSVRKYGGEDGGVDRYRIQSEASGQGGQAELLIRRASLESLSCPRTLRSPLMLRPSPIPRTVDEVGQAQKSGKAGTGENRPRARNGKMLIRGLVEGVIIFVVVVVAVRLFRKRG